MTIRMILLILALVLFLLAGLNIPSPARFNLIGFGLALLTLAALLSTVPITP